MTDTGAPGEEILDSVDPEARSRSRSRRFLGIAVLVAVLAAGFLAFRAAQPDPVGDQAESTAASVTTAPSGADPSLVDASARRLYGEAPTLGAQNFSTAVSAANFVVRIYCRQDIPSWAATLISSGDSYDEATFLMSPANRRYGTFIVQVELTWTVDHFSYAAVAGHVERCS